jgi:hypothetical protein
MTNTAMLLTRFQHDRTEPMKPIQFPTTWNLYLVSKFAKSS